MATTPRADAVAPSVPQRVVTAHLNECWQFAEYRATYRRKASRMWRRYCLKDVPLMVVSLAPGWWPRVKGVG